MLRKFAILALLVCALAPSAYLAWTLRAMPQLGFYHDDSIYWVSAHSLATGNGYRIESLPGQPYQTKYPPVYPALLAGVWKIDPQFPSNLALATLFAWLLLPLFLWMLWILLRDYGFGFRARCVLTLIAALSPVTVVFGFALMPELLFTALLIASLILAERAMKPGTPVWLAAVAGVCAGLAYLTKSVAVPLLVTVALLFALRKHYRKAAVFVATMLPAVAGWQWWVASHLTHTRDQATMYYTDYVHYQLYNVPLHDLPLVIWYNLDGFLMGIGRLMIFDLPYGSKHLERILAVAAIAGCVRLVMRRREFQYALAALGMSAVLLVWHFPPDQRFVFPLYPLLLMGIATELVNIAHVLRLTWEKPAGADRVAAVGVGALLAAVAAFGIFCTAFGLTQFVPDLFQSYRADFQARDRAYAWIEQHAPANTSVYAYEDPVEYLYTGHKSSRLPIPPKFLYHSDDAGIQTLMGSIGAFAREKRLNYLLVTPDDFHRDLNERGARGLAGALQSGAFQRVYNSPGAAVYRLSEPAGGAMAYNHSK